MKLQITRQELIQLALSSGMSRGMRRLFWEQEAAGLTPAYPTYAVGRQHV